MRGKAFSTSHRLNTPCLQNREKLHCRGLPPSSQMHRIRHSSCLISAAISWQEKRKEQGKKRPRKRRTLVQVFACLAHLKEARPGLPASLSAFVIESSCESVSVCVSLCFFYATQKNGEVEAAYMNMQKALCAAQKAAI